MVSVTGPEAAREAFGFDEAYSIFKLDEMLPRLLADQPAVFCALGHDTEWDARVPAGSTRVRQQARSGVTAPGEIHDIRPLLDEMRLFKSAEELQVMRHAAGISAAAHRRAMRKHTSRHERI